MAFKAIPGNTQYEYDDNPPDPGVGNPRRPLWLKSANGIRTVHGHSNYVRCRRIGSGDVDHGEISKSFWDLRSTVSVYAILSLEPKLVFDFKGDYFRKSATASTFGASITHAASTNATMVDSDGLLKWRPHNMLTYNGDLTNASAWVHSRVTVTAGQNDFEGNPTAFKITPTTVSNPHQLYKNQVNSNLVNGTLSTVTVDAKADGYNFFSVSTNSTKYAIINLSDGTVSLDVGSVSPTVTSLGNGWYRCSVTSSTVTQEVFSVVETSQAATFGSQTFTGDGTSGVLVAYPHSFRSDLGGMVNNPDTASSYVPTTTTPVYSPRRGHHIYNGSAWVNEGILHESEARTNLLLSSGDVTGLGWVSQGSGATTVGSVTTGSPFGTYQTVTVNVSDSINSAQRYQIFKSITSGQTYVSSALLKHSVGTFWAVVDVYDTGSGNKRAWFDLQNGVVGTKDAGVLQSGMIDYGDGWWLCWVSATVASNSGGLNVELTKGDGILGRTVGDTLLMAGPQFELGSTPSSYIPTAYSTVTRAAETLTVSAANLPYSSTNMSIQIDGKMTYADTGTQYEVIQYRWQLNATNYISTNIQTITGRTGQPVFSQRQSTSGLDGPAGTINVYNPDVNVPFNIAARHGSTFINGAHEGTLLTADTTPTILPDLSATDLNLGYNFMGTIGQFRMWDEDITDAGITEASA
jgi:hypothetical protein